MSLRLEVQYATRPEGTPPEAAFRHWAEAALNDPGKETGLVIRVVDELESQNLNQEYRGRDGPTNVLSFPFEPPPGMPADAVGYHLGDLVICAPIVAREAEEQGKTLAAHWAHMVVHGVLHLQGMDHQTADQADEMEAREAEILERLGFGDPYDE
ncbi:MAG: rRNA maturation RNase YbeY [Gammaproteobacteria bacterium]|nr:MAG: rRNA maturation RNase YbeY [Gammaproteobacteria bacterium]